MPFDAGVWLNSEVARLTRLLQSETRFLEQVLDALPFGVAVFTRTGELRTGNRVLQTLCPDLKQLSSAVSAALNETVHCPGDCTKKVTLPRELCAQASLQSVDEEHIVIVVTAIQSDAPSPNGSSELSASTLDAVGAPVLVLGPHGEVRHANAAMQLLVGYPAAEFMAIPYSRIDPNTPDAVLGSDGSFHTVVRHRAGTETAVDVFSAGATINHERVRVLTFSTVPSVTVAERDTMAPLERMAGQVAHRLNNALTVVLSYAELLATQYGTVEALASDLNRISEAATAASKITDDLLTFSGGRPNQMVQFEVDRALTSLASMLRTLGDTVPVHVIPGAAGARIKFGQAEFESVLLNLVKNAKEAASQNAGGITVRTARLNPAHSEHIFLMRHLRLTEGAYVTIEVRDSGPGLPAEHGAAVFEPFFTTKPGAVGLGLSTVYGMVKRAGGRVTIERLAEGGTLCRVVLPEANPPE